MREFVIAAVVLASCAPAPVTPDAQGPPAVVIDDHDQAVAVAPTEVEAFVDAFESNVASLRDEGTAPPLVECQDHAALAKRFAEMVELDQYVRRAPSGLFELQIDEATRNEVMTRMMTGAMRVDAEHTSELRAYIEAKGWPRVSEVGETVSHNAWIIAQHADQDRAFQKDVLRRLEELLPEGEVSGRNYAYLWDRVARGEDRPQRYGTQGRCVGPATWEPDEIEDAANVDARRAARGLSTLAEYRTMFVELCRGEDG